jgi:hypothetical protein
MTTTLIILITIVFAICWLQELDAHLRTKRLLEGEIDMLRQKIAVLQPRGPDGRFRRRG